MALKSIYTISVLATLTIIVIVVFGALSLAFQEKPIPEDLIEVVKSCFIFLAGLHLPGPLGILLGDTSEEA